VKTAARENGIYYLEVEGTPYEMGRQHGTALKDEVIQAVADYRANVEKMFGRENVQKIIDWALNQAAFQRDIQRHLPHVLDELRGIADAAGVTLEEMLLLQMFEEVYEAAPMELGLSAFGAAGHGCTAFTALSSGKRFAGQNMDYSGNLLEKQLIIRYRFPNRELLVYGFVGQVGGPGVNSQGLSVFVNTLPQGKKRERDGLGSTFILRNLLEQESVDGALAKLKEIPRFGGGNFTLTDRAQGMVVETDADEVIPRRQSAWDWVVVGTNHVLHLKHRHDMPGVYEDGEPIPYSISLTLERMGSAKRQFDAVREHLSVADIKTILTTSPVCIYHPMFMTLQSGIVEYDGDEIRFYVSGGYDPLRGWNEYTF
jgi:predicted choloylglycine hydrolase